MKIILISLLAIIYAMNPVNAQSWLNVGSAGFSAGIASGTSMAIGRSGTPYVVYADSSKGNKVSVMKYKDSSWVYVGRAGFSAGEGFSSGNWIAIDTGGTPYVVYSDGSGGKATVMKYNDTGWTTVGSPRFSAGNTIYPSIAIDGNGTPYVVYADGAYGGAYGAPATVMKYNGIAWVNVGSPGFTGGLSVLYTSIAIDASGTPYVAFATGRFSGPATVMKYDGSSWVAVGSEGFSAGNAGNTVIAIDTAGTPYVVYGDDANSYKATVMKYSGGSWVAVGSPGFSAAPDGVSNTTIAISRKGTLYVAFQDGSSAGYGATVMYFNGSIWEDLGNSGFSAGQVQYPCIAIDTDGYPYVVYQDWANGKKATVMKPGAWMGVKNVDIAVAASLSLFPNPNNGAFTMNIATTDNEEAHITITNTLGEKVQELTTISNKPTKVNIRGAAGMYFIQVVTKGGSVNEKVVVE